MKIKDEHIVAALKVAFGVMLLAVIMLFVFGESWVNGTMQKGNESYSVEIVNGVLKRENMANSTVQPVKKEKISKKNEIKKVSEQEKSMPIVIYVKELKENQK